MKAHRLSASKDWSGCLLPLRVDVELVPDVKGQGAKDGDAVHGLSEARVTGVVLGVPEACKEHGADPSRVSKLWMQLAPWLDELGAGWAAELFLLYNARTGATRNAKRNDPRDPWEVPAVADLAKQDESDHATTWDIKTGNPSFVKKSQLDVLALSLARWYGVTKVKAGFLFVTEDGVHPESYEYGPDALDRIARDLETTLVYLPEATPEPGQECRFCRVKVCSDGDAMRKRMGWRRAG